ncbi:hypothetical protein F383_27123 [Gossypium arboreum]|uniref:Uncharacterized protein n=1 Tax=Gossypium arboreum TaxID=29729 RepID=A0A0B0PAY3_GOSAR|nr:hypothetical protein F383_27123 [Gossypium arboreum]
MPTSYTWSYTITHIRSYVMKYVRTGYFGRRNFVNTFSNISFSTYIVI